MKRVLFGIFILFLFSAVITSGFTAYDYYDDLLYGSPGTYGHGLLGYINPANLAMLDNPEMILSYADENDKYGIFSALPGIGFGVIYDRYDEFSVKDYRISTGFGNRKFAVGIGYGWSSGDTDYFSRDDVFTLGMLYRPSSMFSVGLSSSISDDGDREAVLDIGLRPFRNDRVSLFGDFAINRIDDENEDRWSAGIAFDVIDGLKITGRYISDKRFTVGMSLSFGKAGLGVLGSFDDESEHSYNTYSLRLGGNGKCLLKGFKQKDRYISMELLGEVSYRKFAMLDKRHTLLEILQGIENAINDDTVGGIAVNTSGMVINDQMIWEIREKLGEFKDAGKKVVMYLDRVSISGYHLASVADIIVMDPMGSITLEGYSAGRTFYRGLLGKLGLGFDEWRFFSYKSAAESFSRDSMSECDREQRQRMIDIFYEVVRDEIVESRNISTGEFDNLVNNIRMFDSDDALEYGLVDVVGRFDKIEDIITGQFKMEPDMVSYDAFIRDSKPDSTWGQKPVLAVVYALGGTDMDTGIKARELSKTIRKLKDNANVKAVIMRVDSPGGDGLASDLVAEAIKECKGIKPFIISQGHVAASGGYWISMNGDIIVASPTTITGSIGVIGGWLYDDGFKEKTGLSYDYVKRGASSDLGQGILIPLINARIPDRNLNDDEKRIMEKKIRSFYREFVELVAEARGRPFEEIERIAQGRIWIGEDALKNGLVDEIGGIEKAIDIALDKIGIKREDVSIIEYPEMGLINLSDIIKIKLFGVERELREDPVIEDILLRIRFNGLPLPILSIDYYGSSFPDY